MRTVFRPAMRSFRCSCTSIAFSLAMMVAVAACGDSKPSGQARRASAEVAGVVEERFDATPYTFLRVKTPDGDVWAAAPMAAVSVGDRIRIANGVPVKGFQPGGMSRHLDRVVFGTIESVGK